MQTLFDGILPNATVPAEAVPRVSRQCRDILARLQQGRASNRTLAGISLKYTGRVSELRQAGYDVRLVSHNRETGVTFYALFTDGQEVQGNA